MHGASHHIEKQQNSAFLVCVYTYTYATQLYQWHCSVSTKIEKENLETLQLTVLFFLFFLFSFLLKLMYAY